MLFRRAAIALFAVATLATPALAFTSDEDGYAIDFPSTWQTRSGYMGTSVIGLSPLDGKADNFSENVNVVVETFNEPVTLDRYSQVSLQNLGKFLTNYKLLEKKTVALDGHPALRLVYDHTQGQFQLRALVWLVVEDGRGYVITGTAKRDTFAKFRPAFDQAAGTFTLAPVESPTPAEED